MSRLQRFHLVSEAALDASPSRKDGISPEVEANRRKVAARHIYETGHAFQMSVGTSAIAVTFFLRYFTRKSMKRNDPFIVSAGCLFLASKVNDEPMPAQNIVVEMFKRWYGRDNPAMRQRLADPAAVQALFTAALEAERAVLYTVGFDFNVDLPHTHVAGLLRLPRFQYLKHNQLFHQLAINFCNDIMRKDGTMVLRYACREIAIAVYYYIFKAAKRERTDSIPQPADEPDGTHWYVKEGLSVQRCQEVFQRISRLYKLGGPAASSAPAASAATTLMPEASVAASVGRSESAAPGGAGAASAAGQQDSAAVAPGTAAAADGAEEDSTAQQRSPVPGQAAATEAAGGSAAGQKRPLEGGGSGTTPVSKVSRMSPPPGAQQVQQQPHQQPPTPSEHRPAPPSRAPLFVPAPLVAAAAAPQQQQPHVAPVAAESEPEEGELEEGELAD